MQDLLTGDVARYRCTGRIVLERFGNIGNSGCGVFEVPYSAMAGRRRSRLRVIASDGFGWDHVSVSLGHRCPTWQEMDFVKRLFFKPDEIVIQLHVATEDHINIHDHCLHLWRPQNALVPLPPKIAV